MLALALALLQASSPVPGSACVTYRAHFPGAPPPPRDEAACGELLAEACDAGRRLACAELGFMLEEGGILHRDPPRAVAYLDRACDAGVPWACYELGMALLRRGEGERGRAALREGCAIGHGAACTARLSDEADPVRALRIAERACDLGDAEGCIALAARTPGGPEVETVERACRLGSSEACSALRLVDLRARCGSGNATDCLQVGVLLEEGRVVAADGAAAAAAYARACDGGRAEGCWRLARLHRFGAGVARDVLLEQRLLAAACAGGEREACRLLAEPGEP